MIKFFILKELFIVFVITLNIVLTIHSVEVVHASTITDDYDSTSPSMIPGKAVLYDTITIPVQKGYVNGNISYFIATDASEKRVVSSVANTTNHTINFSPILNLTSEFSRQQGYEFINGITGDGAFGHQLPVASATVDQEGYSPLFQINYVKWNNESESRILKSVDEIMDAKSNGEIVITKSNIVINSPAVNIK